uniref:Uncharacterized protein n=1 Tax=viral metagenome TaxID=1070528 RepID=A0A6C0LL41_9ZZZZ
MSNAYKKWTNVDHDLLLRYTQQNYSVRQIAQLLKRSEVSIRKKRQKLFAWIIVNSKELWKKLQTRFAQLPEELHRIIFQFYIKPRFNMIRRNCVFGNEICRDVCCNKKPILCIYPKIQEEKYIENHNSYADFMFKEHEYMIKVFRSKEKKLINHYGVFKHIKVASKFIILRNKRHPDKYYITCGYFPLKDYPDFITIVSRNCPNYKALEIKEEINKLLPPCDNQYCVIKKQYIQFPNYYTLSKLQRDNLLVDITKLF